MNSLGWFLVIVAVIMGIVLGAIVLGGLFIFLIEGGGCAVTIGLLLIAGGITLAVGGGLAGGFGILIGLIGAGLIWLGVGMFREHYGL